MLKKKERLTRELFDRSFSVGKRYHTPSLQVIVAPSASFHGSVVVGKKVSKQAVKRNRLRRQLYALLYQFHVAHGLDSTYILIAKPSIASKKREDFALELKEVLPKTRTDV